MTTIKSDGVCAEIVRPGAGRQFWDPEYWTGAQATVPGALHTEDEALLGGGRVDLRRYVAARAHLYLRWRDAVTEARRAYEAAEDCAGQAKSAHLRLLGLTEDDIRMAAGGDEVRRLLEIVAKHERMAKGLDSLGFIKRMTEYNRLTKSKEWQEALKARQEAEARLTEVRADLEAMENGERPYPDHVVDFIKGRRAEIERLEAEAERVGAEVDAPREVYHEVMHNAVTLGFSLTCAIVALEHGVTEIDVPAPGVSGTLVDHAQKVLGDAARKVDAQRVFDIRVVSEKAEGAVRCWLAVPENGALAAEMDTALLAAQDRIHLAA